MILNNSAQQPDSVGHTRIGFGKDSIMRISADSTAYDFCVSIGEAIMASPIFEDVRLCEDTMRTDSAFFISRTFSPREVEELCKEYGVDALISLDKLFFRTKLTNASNFNGVFWGGSIEMELLGELRAYWAGMKDAYAIPFRDSLAYINEGFEPFTQQDVYETMRYFANYEGDKMHVNFVPSWSQDNRWFYTDFSSEWKKGTAYAVAEKWNEAETIWKNIVNQTNNKKKRAKLYSNLALCSEITGNFEKAIENAEKSYKLYEEAAGEEDSFVKLQKRYIDILNKRAKDDDLLSKQLKEK
jgi:tetratricopeptide (TPR) repeat protein